MKSKSFVLMILSLGFGLVAAIGISQVMRANNANAQPLQEMGPVLVAGDFLDMKTDLTEENVRIENWPAAIIPEDAATSLEDIKDMSLQVRMSKGMPIVKSTLIHKNSKSVIQIPEGYKVVAIKVSGDDMIGGLLNPGDKVDVIGLFKKKGRDGQQQTISRTFLKALRVFSVNNKLSANIDRQETTTSGSAIVGVLVTEKQSEEIVYVQKTGDIKLVLRGEYVEGDNDVESIEDIMQLDESVAGNDGSEGNNPASFASSASSSAAAAVSGLFQQYAQAAVGAPAEPTSVIVWKGGEVEKYIIAEGEVPQRIGSGEAAVPPLAPALSQPIPASNLEDSEALEDEDDFDGGAENDRDAEEDQYPSQ